MRREDVPVSGSATARRPGFLPVWTGSAGFVAAVVLVAFLAWHFGLPGGLDRETTGESRTLAIFAIFFFQGLRLPLTELIRGLRRFRLHGLIQCVIFGLNPVLFGGAAWVLGLAGQPTLAAGLLFVGFLPTTIASAVAYTDAAGGSVPVALFNAVAANLLGILLVPLLGLLLLGGGSGSGLPLAVLPGVYSAVLLLVALPLLLGQSVRRWAGEWRLRTFLERSRWVTQSLILYILYVSLASRLGPEADSFGTGLTLGLWLLLGGLSVALMLAIHGLLWLGGAVLRLERAERIALLFCGGQKTLAAGLPLALLLYPDGRGLSGGTEPALFLMPLIIYHPLHLIFGAFLIPLLQGNPNAD